MDLDKILDSLKAIDLTKVDGDSLKLSQEAEDALERLLTIETFVEEAKTKLKERFVEIAKENPKLKKYEGDKVSVGYRVTRRKEIKGNPDDKFVIVEKKPNTKAIDAYRDATGDLPTGIDEKTFEYITFKLN